MKTPAVSLLLGVCVLLLSALAVSAVSLQVSPNLQQIFKNYASSVSLSCVDDEGETADGWKVMITTDDYSYDCADSLSLHGYGVGYYSFCILDSFFSSDPLYFCENSSGQQSDEVSISISDRSVILEIPALPVRAGSNVTLRCRNHRGSKVEAYFFINGSHVGAEHKSELIITNVQRSDEGVYLCSVGVDEESLKSFLRVREPAVTPSSSPRPPFLPPFLLLLTFCLY
uniref:Ig-like domain-containing protein n=1 Tax=Astatotilapia calliptera TaxID=8154 RepID=A0AAX7UJ93_ASTCA